MALHFPQMTAPARRQTFQTGHVRRNNESNLRHLAMTPRKVCEELGKPWIRSRAGFARSPAVRSDSDPPVERIMVPRVGDIMAASMFLIGH